MKPWDYKNITAEYWNPIPIEEQLELLKKYYPIGIKCHQLGLIGDNIGKPDTSRYFTIIGYNKITLYKNDIVWKEIYILSLKCSNPKNYEKEIESIHPGLVIPSFQDIREMKLNLILE